MKEKEGAAATATATATAIAASVAEEARRGDFAAIGERFAPALRALVSADAVRTAWAAQVAGTGPVTAVRQAVAERPAGGLVRVSTPLTCERGAFTLVISVDGAGLLHGLRLASPDAAAWTPPPYADPGRFTEHPRTVGSGPLAVPGTLSLPRTPGPHPGVVLLSGGGPFDRDATAGPHKPLKDLAWGLASAGVAVLRFDKVTHAHPAEVAALPHFTMADEYVPHAVAAVRLLRAHPAVDPARVVVAGHSMGGKAAPRVAAAEPSVAGLAILAGDAQPMHHAAVRVARHLTALDPAADRSLLDTLTRQAALVDSPALTPATPAVDLPFGLSGAYWLDLRAYDPVASAAALVDTPLLLLQGARDYQVTVADDLARWRAGLARHPDVTVRVHDAANHLFVPGAGPSTPAEYARPGHVDPAVLTDLTTWLACLPR
ncbi:alpha/beta hydrolase [Streptomyces sp. RS10V-4]|uniref:alpha/beta hydrolase family protein n=1 Tax=Streptomyces rhizoryzae TaxID=2932493 RepID=UPI002004839F|nr:alpha/beta hydrolase [Streptomyces rhizoryzae]MCK7622263.1 alpha/beta hydrolase [Streptomyces rhizoryzae]